MGLEQTPALEETPSQFPEEQQTEPTGNTSSCYLCGRSFHQLPAEYIIRREYEYNGAEKGQKIKRRFYFMTFCLWCAHSYKL
jgi:hypothetical protein